MQLTNPPTDLAIRALGGPLSFPRSRRWRFGEAVQIGMPGIPGGAFFTPFLVEMVGGAPQVALRPDAVPDAALTVRTMAPGVLGTLSTAGGGSDVTKTFTQWNNSGVGDIILAATLSVQAGSSLLIDFETALYNQTVVTIGAGSFIKLIVNGTTVRTLPYIPVIINAGANTAVPMVFREIVNGLPGGATTVEVLMYINVTNSANVIASAPKFIFQEVFNPSVVDVTATITPSVTYITSIVGGTSGSFLGTSIGTASLYRNVVVTLGFVQSSMAAWPTMTIGGIAATRRGVVSDAYNSGYRLAMYSLRVPTGTTADIIATFSSAVTDAVISVWDVVAASAAPISITGGYTWIDSPASPTTVIMGGITSAVGQVMTCAAYGDNAACTDFVGTWGGADTVNKRAVGSTANRLYGAYDITFAHANSAYFEATCVPSESGPAVGLTAVWQ
jgi:hypothetical protein